MSHGSEHTDLTAITRLLSSLNCGAMLIDRGGHIVHANPRLCEMMSRTCAQLVGVNLIDLYDTEDDRAMVRESLARWEQASEQEFFLPLPGGTKLPIITTARPLPLNGDASQYSVVTVIDISRQKQAEQSATEQYQLVLEMSDTLLQQALELKRYSQTLEQRVKERTSQLHDAHMDAIYMLAVAAEAKDQDTGKHVRRIERQSREVALRMGFSEPEADAIGYSAILHDVGKIHVPDDILGKPGPLDDRERARMQLHTLAGERILSRNPFFDRARRIARAHHENWDGSGYPDGISGTSIPIEARIVHVVDVYDALRHDRVYKKAWSRDQTVAEIVGASGRMFDPEVVGAFESAVRNGDDLAS